MAETLLAITIAYAAVATVAWRWAASDAAFFRRLWQESDRDLREQFNATADLTLAAIDLSSAATSAEIETDLDASRARLTAFVESLEPTPREYCKTREEYEAAYQRWLAAGRPGGRLGRPVLDDDSITRCDECGGTKFADLSMAPAFPRPGFKLCSCVTRGEVSTSAASPIPEPETRHG